MFTFRQYIPTKTGHLVKSMWYMEHAGGGEGYEEEIVPDGHHELIFYLDGRSQHRIGNGAWIDEPGALIASQTLQSHRLRMSAGSKLYGIRFYPHTLYPLLGVPLHLLGSAMMPMDDLLKGDGLAACIDEDVTASFRRLEHRLLGLLSERAMGQSAGLLRGKAMEQPGYAYVDHSVRRMLAGGGPASIKTLVGKSGVTAKHYDELFKRYVGITPKCLSSILQLNSFIRYKNRFPAKTLTECVYEAGYYDQSHLIRAFNQWVGATPGQYFHSRAEISDLFAAL
ncbi:AraC family transcriptional regulator [Puia dinghuensis]|uniref:AraC family transcriptional regulator n=2 Tax=Puia dinghuensis TaxID=1792502 RepID=A0A8J2UJ69_9BACT|nr:AraC family transcriptional regulator [Puia dinghuensis]